MTKKEKINEIYAILIQFEKKNEVSYLNYLDRLYMWYFGDNNEQIYNSLKGLYKMGLNATHDTVKRMVFHMISVLDKGRD